MRGKLEPDIIDKKEYRDIGIKERVARIDAIRQSNADRRINRKLRTKFAGNVLCYLVCYSIFAACVIVFSGLGWIYVADTVLASIVGSTAIAAIGLVGFVVSGLFKNIN